MYYPYIPKPIPCSYPEQPECGFQMFLVGTKWVRLCKYRIVDLGINACVEEKEALKNEYERREK
jgi:hypothetical protein